MICGVYVALQSNIRQSIGIENDLTMHYFRDLIYVSCGVSIPLEKSRSFIALRLQRRLNELKLDSFEDYQALIDNDPTGEELQIIINLISTNKTDFFRQRTHYQLLSQWIHDYAYDHREITIWSAAASSGEEAYSIAMTLADAIPNYQSYNIKILATDINTDILNKAQQGIYREDLLENIPAALRRQFFTPLENGQYQISPELKRLVFFRQANLTQPFPFTKHFDVIFCCNVMIYFDQPTQEDLLARIHAQLKSGGLFFTDLSEALINIKHSFKYLRPSVYIK